jgi:hypothetical protein
MHIAENHVKHYQGKTKPLKTIAQQRISKYPMIFATGTRPDTLPHSNLGR